MASQSRNREAKDGVSYFYGYGSPSRKGNVNQSVGLIVKKVLKSLTNKERGCRCVGNSSDRRNQRRR